MPAGHTAPRSGSAGSAATPAGRQQFAVSPGSSEPGDSAQFVLEKTWEQREIHSALMLEFGRAVHVGGFGHTGHMSEPVNADEIRENIKASLLQLLLLQEQGRIVMSEDRFNTDWPDSAVALTEAISALRRAVSATAWMETLPHPDGGYPPLET